MEEWKEYKLGDLYDVHNGLSKGGKFFGSGYPFLSFKTVFNNYFLPPVLPDLVQSDEKEQNGYNIKRGDVFVTRTSETSEELGMSSVALKDYPFATYNGFTKRLRPKDPSLVFPEFIGYYLRSTKFRNLFYGLASSMSTRASLANGDLLGIKVFLPSYETQERIAWILKSLDDKIELNRRINENLEQQAQALFKSWFVDFEPFKDSKFVDSELGRIPEGWKVKKLEELCDSISVTHPYKKGQLIFLNTGDIENGFVLNHKYMNIKDMPGQAKKSIQENDILYSEIRPINRHFAFVNFPAQEYIVSTKLMVIRAVDKKSAIRLYQYLTSDDVINELQHEAESRSGTFPQIRFENIKKIKILIGPNDIENQYIEFIGNIYKMIFQYRKEIIKLEGLRDTLLPKLMSGELKINDFNN